MHSPPRPCYCAPAVGVMPAYVCTYCEAPAVSLAVKEHPVAPLLGAVPPPQFTKIHMPVQVYREPDTVRSTYRELNGDEKIDLALVKERGQALIDALKRYVPEGRMRSIAMTRAEEAVMWATKALTT